MRSKILLFLCVVIITLTYSNNVHAYGNGFTYSRSITIDHTKVSNTDQTNFPVLVSGIYSYLATVANGGKVTNISGYDIGFYTNSDCSTGKMSWETEGYASTTGVVNYWVKVATASASTDTVFYICYGNSSITTDQSAASSVWNSDFKGVWHLPNGSTLTANDSTSNARNGTLVNTPTAVAGRIGGAARFVAASTQYINLVDDMNNTDSSGTISAWVYPTTNTQQMIFCLYNSTSDNNMFAVGLLNGSNSPSIYAQAYNFGSYNDAVRSPENVVPLNAWTHVAFTGNGSTYKLYVNGVSQTVTVLSFANNGRWFYSINKTVGKYRIGYCNTTNPAAANYTIDDIKLSNTVRGDDWIKTEYNNQSATSTFYAFGSESNATAPSLTTSAPTSVSTSTLTLNGSITSTGGVDATQSGFAYGTSATLTSGVSTSTLGAQTGTATFSSNLTGLTPNTVYYFRAYATNTAGTGYGSILSTTTLAVSAPTVTTQAASSVTATTATGNGNITVTGNINPTVRGFAYGLTIAYGATTTESGNFSTGAFTGSISSLTCNTLYHIKAYATNSSGTSFGSDQTFTTSACVQSITTSAVSSVATSTASFNASITATGGADATQSGFAYGTLATLATVISTSTLGSQTGTATFTSDINGLTSNTTYYVRAYSTNSAGTSFGSIVSFTTDPVSVPTVSESAATGIDMTNTTINGSVDSIGNITVTARGFEWGTDSSYGTIISNSGAFGIGSFTSDLTGLTCNTIYYFRAFATNSVGTASSTGTTFITSACPAPSSSPSSSSNSSGSRSIIKPATNPILWIRNVLTPGLVQPQSPIQKLEKPVIVVKPEPPLEGEWNLLSKGLVHNFVLAPLPKDVTNLTNKFPDLAKLFTKLQISKMTDLEKLQNVAINLPTISDNKNIPSEVVVVRNTNQNITLGSTVSVSTEGEVRQKIKTIVGKSITLSLKPDSVASAIKGYILFKKKTQTTAMEMPAFTMAASAFLAQLNVIKKPSQEVIVEKELLVNSFEYTDLDKDGIYTAEISTPATEGEYEILSVISYKDTKKGSKEIRMTTVVDPEGYVYRVNNGEETRVLNAKVSIWNASDDSLWQATDYNQENPVITDKTGKYSFLVPQGKYYITVETKGYGSYKGEVFEVKQSAGIHTNIELFQTKSLLRRIVDALIH
jgi:hypothetical protein